MIKIIRISQCWAVVDIMKEKKSRKLDYSLGNKIVRHNILLLLSRIDGLDIKQLRIDVAHKWDSLSYKSILSIKLSTTLLFVGIS